MNIVITGGSRGIGRDIAAALDAIDVSRNGEVKADLSKHGEAERAAEELQARYGAIDVLVNNARAERGDPTEETWDTMMAVNLRSAYFLSRALYKNMRDGLIVNIGSISGRLVSREFPAYQVSKAGIEHLTRIMAVEFAPVRVNCIAEGLMAKDGRKPDGPHGTGRDVADLIRYMMRAKFMTGATVNLDGGAALCDPYY